MKMRRKWHTLLLMLPLAAQAQPGLDQRLHEATRLSGQNMSHFMSQNGLTRFDSSQTATSGTVIFNNTDGSQEGRAELISIYTRDGHYVWGWGNSLWPSVGRTAATTLSAVGDRDGIAVLQTSAIPMDPDSCAELTYLAVPETDVTLVIALTTDAGLAFVGFNIPLTDGTS